MITGRMLRDAIVSGANNITNLKSSVDELNVFPVPDGDTGTNMSMTINSAVPELMRLPDDCTVEAASSVAASGLLRGARGNSGVILSLLFRGLSRALQGKAEATSEDLYESLCKGVRSAYKAVMKPTEGTILTVARVASEKAADVYATLSPIDLWAFIVEECKKTLETTPELLPVLKKAGVVDAGGQGLVYIFEGMLDSFKAGGIVGADAKPEAGKSAPAEEADPKLDNRYSAEFTVIKSAGANYEKLRAYLESIGDSVTAADDGETISCRLDTENPGRALGEAIKHGRLTKIKIENLLEQYRERKAGGKEAASDCPPQPAADSNDEFPYVKPDESVEYGFVTVCAGDGLKQLFTDLGVDRVVSGGQTMNPSTDDILRAVQSIAAKNILVLANNKNIIMAAEQACKLADRSAVVLATRTIPQGVSAMIAFMPDATLKQNIINMNAAADKVTTGQVTFAARDSDFDGKKIKQGEILALSNGKLAAVDGTPQKAAVKLAKKLVNKNTSFVTVIYGCDVTEEDANAAADAMRKALPSSVELTLVNGGQPVYYYYISAE